MAIEEHNVQTKDIVNIIDGDGDVDGGFRGAWHIHVPFGMEIVLSKPL